MHFLLIIGHKSATGIVFLSVALGGHCLGTEPMDLGFREKEVLYLLGSTDGRNCSGVELEEEKSD